MIDLFAPETWADSPESVEPSRMPNVRNTHGKRLTMLARLKVGPLSTFDAERLIHRGQATIGDLRSRGHIIDLVKLEGVDCYVWRLHKPVSKVSRSMQERYYATEHWRQTALARKELDAFVCQQCKSTDNLETHHWRYNLFAESVRFDLVTLCRDCHSGIHEEIGGSEVHFPRFVSAEIANRLLE